METYRQFEVSPKKQKINPFTIEQYNEKYAHSDKEAEAMRKKLHCMTGWDSYTRLRSEFESIKEDYGRYMKRDKSHTLEELLERTTAETKPHVIEIIY